MAMLCLNGGLGEASEEEIRFDILWSRKDKKDMARQACCQSCSSPSVGLPGFSAGEMGTDKREETLT